LSWSGPLQPGCVPSRLQLHGGRLVVVPHLVSRSARAFYDLLHAERVTGLGHLVKTQLLEPTAHG
jgi:hypothetical protein